MHMRSHLKLALSQPRGESQAQKCSRRTTNTLMTLLLLMMMMMMTMMIYSSYAGLVTLKVTRYSY